MKYSLIGIGSAILDIVVEVSEEFVSNLGIDKSTVRIVDLDTQKKLLEDLSSYKKIYASGGSIANSVVSFSQATGLKSALVSCFSNEEMGKRYVNECEEKNVDCLGSFYDDNYQGTCVCLVTPDGERTMQVNLGVCQNFSSQTIKNLPEADLVLFEGYLFFNPESDLIFSNLTKSNLVLSLSDQSVVNFKKDFILSNLDKIKILVGNKFEYFALFGISSVEELKQLIKNLPIDVLVTMGEEGAFYCSNGSFYEITAQPTKVLDLTGAGDMFLAIFLAGHITGKDYKKSLEIAAKYSSLVISQYGARLEQIVL